MIFYLTYNDLPSGIYASQVIDVVKFVKRELKKEIYLVALISIRHFFEQRKKIKIELSEAIVLPMFPGVKNWQLNVFTLWLLCFFYRPEKICARSILATQLALKLKTPKRKIVYDGRGAIAAEWREYKVITDKNLLKQSAKLEKESILKADYRLAVSQKLADYWKETYQYNSQGHVIIPCTLNHVFESLILTPETVSEARQLLGFKKDDIIFAYSGSIAGWQSFELLYNFISPILKSGKHYKIFFLSEEDKNIRQLKTEFPEQVLCKKINVSKVPEYLISADYGLLIREQSITNKVASPVKFAEYLACGLKVIISENLGDYSNFVKEYEAGYLITEFNTMRITTPEEKTKLRNLALDQFVKNKFKTQYLNVIA